MKRKTPQFEIVESVMNDVRVSRVADEPDRECAIALTVRFVGRDGFTCLEIGQDAATDLHKLLGVALQHIPLPPGIRLAYLDVQAA